MGLAASAGAILCFLPHTGQIAVNVADAKGSRIPRVSISIDGKPQCDSAPCIVAGVAAGSHTVKVEANGFEPPADKAVAVEPRKDTTVDFNLLVTNGGTGIRVTGQPGTTLFVDDKEIGPLPQILNEMAPGSHKVKIAGGERYAPLEKTVTISQDELQDLGAVTLKVVKGKATISPETSGAGLFLVSGSDRWTLPPLPISLDIDTSKPWSLVASKPGFDDYSQPIRFDDGQAEKAVRVSLDPKTAAERPTPAYAATAQTPATDGAVAAAGRTFLTINSIPASSVILDGKPIGSTPKLKYRVSPGTHSLVFLNPEQGFKRQISVTVAAGETRAAISRN
jgi:serine/threonine-protein kinase